MSGYTAESVSAVKIPPLDSPQKSHQPHADSHGVVGEDYVLQSTHIDPFPHVDHVCKPEGQ